MSGELSSTKPLSAHGARLAAWKTPGPQPLPGLLGYRAKQAAKAPANEADKARITAKMIRSVRERLGISRDGFAKLVGVSPNSVYLWENKEGRLQFRGDTKARIVALRKMTKAETQRQLGEMDG